MGARLERHTLRHRIHPVDVVACGDGEPLVLLHGWGLSGEAYGRTMQAFAADGWRVIAPTLRPGESWSLAHVADIVAEAMAGLDATPAAIVGHSYGGAVGAACAIAHPGFVTSLVAMATPFVPLGAGTVRRFLTPGRQYRLAGHAGAVRSVLRTARNPMGLVNMVRVARWFLAGEHLELRDGLKALQLPRTLLWAEGDSLFDIDVAIASAEVFGGRFVRVENADGHPVDHDYPMRFPNHFARTAGALVRIQTSAPPRPRQPRAPK
jgi:pimeloyl-ACP methyl ester carboxylesterase